MPLSLSIKNQTDQNLGRFGRRALRIAANTISIIDPLRNDWTGGISAGMAWLGSVQVERGLPPPQQLRSQNHPSVV